MEFEDRESLQEALKMNGNVIIENMVIKVDVAEGKRNDRGGGFDRRGRGPGGPGFGRNHDGNRGGMDDYGNKFSKFLETKQNFNTQRFSNKLTKKFVF